MAVAVGEARPGEVETDVVSLSIPASMKFVKLVRIGAASLARRRGFSVRVIDDLRIAIDETFTLILGNTDHDGHVDVTFEIDDDELLISVVQNLSDGAITVDPQSLVHFESVLGDLTDRFEADPENGFVQFAKTI